MMREEHLKLREKHQKAASMLRDAHQFERDVLAGRIDIEAILEPPQKHYREQPKIAVNAPLPSLTPHLVPKPPALRLNIIKKRTKQHLFNLEEQERTSKSVKKTPKSKFGDNKPKLKSVPNTQNLQTTKSAKSKKDENWLDRSLSSKANSAFEKSKSAKRTDLPEQKTEQSRSTVKQDLAEKTLKDKANEVFEKSVKKPEKPKKEQTIQKKKGRPKRRKRANENLSKGQLRAKAIAREKARKARAAKAKQRGEDLSRKR